MVQRNERPTFSDVRFVKLVTVGSVNPNNPLSEQSKEEQEQYLNRCLNDFPKGIILSKDTTIGRYALGEHELTMEKVTYHVGFPRKPVWMEE